MPHVLALIVSLLASTAPARAGDVGTGDVELSSNADDAVTQARHAFAQGRFEEAATAWGAIADAGGGATARLAQAMALYEGGSLHAARAAAEKALLAAPGDVPTLNVLGVTLVDNGAREDGLRRLREALPRASGVWRARVLVNIALGCADGGDAAGAEIAIREATPLVAGNAALAQALEGAKTSLAALQGTDGGVGQALARGDLAGAKAQAEAQAEAARAAGPRAAVTAAIALAAVDRAEGRLGAAGSRLDQAVSAARKAGLARETAVALGNLGIVHSLAGRAPIAIDALRAAAEAARAGGYRVIEVDARTELGLAYTRIEDAASAVAQQQAVGSLLAQMQYPAGVARHAELGGAVAALAGDTATADAAFGRAAAWYEQQGRTHDAARVATLAAGAWEGRDPGRCESWGARAEGLFKRAGDALGPAHVRMARGLAAAREGRTDAALEHFARAASLAKAVPGERAAIVHELARGDAAKVLVRAGDTPESAEKASRAGLQSVVAREKLLRASFAAYDDGRKAYDSKDWARARAFFDSARKGFESLGEPGYTTRAARAGGWATYNRLVGTPVAQAHDGWQDLVKEVAPLGDDELYLRTYAAAALATHKTNGKDPGLRLSECGKMAERQGYPELAARCLGALAERPGELKARAQHARTAFAFAPDEAAAVYALYVVAVDAVNEEQPALARELAQLAKPRAGGLAAAIEEVLAATR